MGKTQKQVLSTSLKLCPSKRNKEWVKIAPLYESKKLDFHRTLLTPILEDPSQKDQILHGDNTLFNWFESMTEAQALAYAFSLSRKETEAHARLFLNTKHLIFIHKKIKKNQVLIRPDIFERHNQYCEKYKEKFRGINLQEAHKQAYDQICDYIIAEIPDILEKKLQNHITKLFARFVTHSPVARCIIKDPSVIERVVNQTLVDFSHKFPLSVFAARNYANDLLDDYEEEELFTYLRDKITPILNNPKAYLSKDSIRRFIAETKKQFEKAQTTKDHQPQVIGRK